ncbi:MAG: hydroxyethylthiazole kinase [Chloroflexaceae bacterium]|nr:hydroxyethylthiazole kinase [Chloroflexaceae bacterium]
MTNTIDKVAMADLLSIARVMRPLIHHLTNDVVMNDTANMTLFFGGLPVMTAAREEVVEMVQAASALVLNIGTLTPAQVETMLIAGHAANARNIPIILDPVGAGATQLRTDAALRLLRELRIEVLRGNLGEIGAVSGMGGEMRGVESIGSDADPRTLAREAARSFKTVVAITGPRDLISDGQRLYGVDNGHNWLTTLTGTGCMATTAIATCAAVATDALLATTTALAAYGLAAERAAKTAGVHGPGSFKAAFFDQAYTLTSEQLYNHARIVDLSDPTATA